MTDIIPGKYAYLNPGYRGEDKPKARGFAAMSPEKRREIQSKGGQNSPTNFKNRSPEERKQFGKKGGAISKRVYEKED